MAPSKTFVFFELRLNDFFKLVYVIDWLIDWLIDMFVEGIELKLPRATKNFYVDGHIPQPH